MKNLYRIIRTLVVLAVVVPVALPVMLYITLSVPAVQGYMAKIARKELTDLLGTDVNIGDVDYAPFNRIVVSEISVADPLQPDSCALTIKHLGAGISFMESLWQQRPVVTYAEIIGLNLRLRRDSASAPLNIQPIIDRFKKPDTGKRSNYDLAVNLIVIRSSGLSYDVMSAPRVDDGRFDPAHIYLRQLRADLRAPVISDSTICAEIKRLGATEMSGLRLSTLTAKVNMTRKEILISNLALQMPNSRLAFEPIEINGSPLGDDFDIKKLSTHISTLPGTHISSRDISPLLPQLENADLTLDIGINARGGLKKVFINNASLSVAGQDINISATGALSGLDGGRDSMHVSVDNLLADIDMPALCNIAGRCNEPALTKAIERYEAAGRVRINGQGAYSKGTADLACNLTSECGSADIDAGMRRNSADGTMDIDGKVSISDLNPSALFPNIKQLTDITCQAQGAVTLSSSGKDIRGKVEVEIPQAVWSGYSIDDVVAEAEFSGNHVELGAHSNDPLLDFTLHCGADLSGERPLTEIYAYLRNISLSPWVKTGRMQHCDLTAEINASVHGHTPDALDGWLSISDLTLTDRANSKKLFIDTLTVTSNVTDSIHNVSLQGGPLDVKLNGRYTYAALSRDIMAIMSKVFPALIPDEDRSRLLSSVADLSITVNPDTVFTRFFNLPVEVIYPVSVSAAIYPHAQIATANLDAPYLKQKDKLIENTTLSARMDGRNETANVEFASLIPTKNGPLDLTLHTSAHTDTVESAVSWHIDRATDFHGDLDLQASFKREDGQLRTLIDIHPTEMVFNDAAWHVTPARVEILPKHISVTDLGASRDGQSLSINGVAGTDSLDRLVVTLDHIDLDYLFETLALSDAVVFGGRATGRLFAEGALSPAPVLYTPRLMVEGLSYNHCTFGNGDIRSKWDNNTKSVTIDATIDQTNGKQSLIHGYIRPMTEELDFKFSAQDAPAGFMLPFMSAFTSSVSGQVSGDAHLFGTFKDLDIVGDIYARDLKMKLDFTNTVYTVTDSVHLTPGLITFTDVDLQDRFGNHANLSGRVTHTYFHDPTFRFDISDAKDVLVYDISERDTTDPWYGRIYGSGSATVTGVPGKIDIGVKMRTGPKSTFTFVLSDEEQSVEYDFITLRDRYRHAKDSIAALDPTPLIVRQLRDRVNKQDQGTPSVYAMEFNVDITPEATLNLVMDPVGGDKITAHGTGNLRMGYSSDGELEMFGEYTLNRGSYNFTLQDIIIKDFTILEGSKITFLGDPYAAQLNIRAAYTLNANLSDLDESFLEDRELNRTNVKVNAIMMVTGDMRQPDIKFDLEFPTLTADTYRKVRSIISTDEMMSRQIIYLLALNRFYTPEYMATTHGNELVSVASSTLSSRLGSMLGQLSDRWSISPAIRSDRGDFSDVEVDVALSSQLLDNRLLFNGNLGYRDKTLNNNSFIGDFDIRYLLNRAGTIQLKAYNRYNDQNYYLKSALTTQGVGVVFKRDFDNIFSFLRPLKRKSESNDEATDSVTVNTDIIIDEMPDDNEESESDFITIRPQNYPERN